MTAGSAVTTTAAAVCLTIFSLSGCSTELPPFEADYLSRDTVAITYQGKQHLLNRHGSSAPVPFQYRFEEDGDLDLVIDGRSYEVDSPYDRDRSRKKKAVKKVVPTKPKPSKSAKNRR